MGRRLSRLLDMALGARSSFSLEHRLFNAISLLNGFFNLAGALILSVQAQAAVSLLHTVVGLLFFLFYYLARVRKLFRGLYWPFVLLIAGFLWVNALANDASRGAAHYYLVPALVIAVILSPRTSTTIWAAGLFGSTWLSLVAIEYWRPDWVMQVADPRERLLDVGGQFLFVQWFTAALVGLVARSLDQERTRAERLLFNVNAIMQSVNDSIITADSRGRITSWNRAAAEMFGISEEEAVGQPLTIIIPPRYREDHREGIRRIVNRGESHVLGQTVELSALRHDGEEFPVELSLSSWRADGDVFFSGVIRDITKRKQAEEALRQSRQQLEAKAAELAAAKREVEAKNEQLEGLAAKLAKYLSRQVYSSIFSGEKDVKIESYRRKLTIFFSDVKGFTDLTDSMEPEELSSLLNSYLDEMSRVAARHGGTIDKFIGDAIMIFFGDPESRGEKEDALACARMALEMRLKMPELRKRWASDWGISRPLQIRMGINTGYCTVGNFGSEERLDYTIIGGQVNLASRLESAAETDQILISGETYSLIQDQIACEPRGEIRVKGIARPVQTYQIIDHRSDAEASLVRFQEEFEGFSLDVDLERLAEPQRSRAVRVLRKALNSLSGQAPGAG